MKGEKIYEYEVSITGATDFGVSMDAILSGQTPVPPQGVRIDISFDGRGTGRLAGRVHGTDYVRFRADGRADLDIRGVIETDDGHRIALWASGVAVPRADEPVVDLSENVTLGTAAAPYAWVNARQIWATGTVNLATGTGHIEGYMQ